MKDYIKDLWQQFGLRIALLFIAFVICLNAILIIYYRGVMIHSNEMRQQIEEIRVGLNAIESHIHLGDLGVRAYLIKPTDAFLAPYMTAKDSYLENLEILKANLDSLGFEQATMQPAINAIAEYMEVLKLMVDLCNNDRTDEALEIFYEDRGYTAWQRYSPFLVDATEFIEDQSTLGQAEYKNSINLILLILFILIIVSVPIIIAAYGKIKRDALFRKQIFNQLNKSNREYLFDEGKGEAEQNADTITES